MVGAQVFSGIPVTPALTGSLDLGTVPTLALDTDGDGTTDETLEPSGTLDARDSQDFYPAQPEDQPAAPVQAAPILLPVPENKKDAQAQVQIPASAPDVHRSAAAAPARAEPQRSLLAASVIGSGAGSGDGSDRSELLLVGIIGLLGWAILAEKLIKK